MFPLLFFLPWKQDHLQSETVPKQEDLVPDPTPIKGPEQDVGPASSPASSQINTVAKSAAPSSDAQVSDIVQGMTTEGAVPKGEPKEVEEEEEMEVDSGAGGDGGDGVGGGTEDLLEWKDGIATLPGSSMKVGYFNRFIIFISFS